MSPTHDSLRAPRAAVATVTDDRFLPGTLVLLSSFLHHNPWFDGDLVVIHDELSAAGRAALATFPNVRLHAVEPPLAGRLDAIAARFPPAKRPIFYSLEAFNLPQYSRVLKLDSDMLCTGDASDLFATDAALACCPDQCYLRGRVRDRRTYRPIDAPSGGATAGVLPMTFNAGMMLIAPGRLPASAFDDLLDLLQPRTWDAVESGHTDSVVLNRYFEGRWTPVDERYNYLTSKQTDRATRARPAIDEAIFLHFVGRRKPWRSRDEGTAMSDERRAALRLWRDAWTQAARRLDARA